MLSKNKIVEGSITIAEYLGWVYIPYNNLQGLSKPGWYRRVSSKPVIEEVKFTTTDLNLNAIETRVEMLDSNLFNYSRKQGWELVGEHYYKYVTRRHTDLRFYNSFDELMIVLERLVKDDSMKDYMYSWGDEYNFTSIDYHIDRDGCTIFMNLQLDPTQTMSSEYSKENSLRENVFRAIVGAISYIHETVN